MLNSKEFKLKEDIMTRDGIIKKGTKSILEEINKNEITLEEKTPYRIIFLDNKNSIGGGASDWFSKKDLINFFEPIQ